MLDHHSSKAQHNTNNEEQNSTGLKPKINVNGISKGQKSLHVNTK